jgi:hypothetical protein
VSTTQAEAAEAPGSSRPPTVPRVAVGSAAANAACQALPAAASATEMMGAVATATQVEGVETAAVEAELQRGETRCCWPVQVVHRDRDVDDCPRSGS